MPKIWTSENLIRLNIEAQTREDAACKAVTA